VANSDITNGAQFLASLNLDGQQQVRLRSAAQEMGLTEAETYKLLSRAIKKLERNNPDDSNIGKVVDTFIKRATDVAGVNADIPQELKGITTIPTSQVESGEFGNQDELQNFGGVNERNETANISQANDEIAKARGRRDPNLATRGYFDKGDRQYKTEEMYIPDGTPMPERFKEDMKARDFGVQMPDQFAPAQQILGGELARLQAGIDTYGADAFPGSADLVGRIEDDLFGAKGSERSLVEALVRQDAMRQNPDMVRANNEDVRALANIIGQDFQVGGRGAAADQAIANIGSIIELGPAKVGTDFQVSQNPRDLTATEPLSVPIDLINAEYSERADDGRMAGPLQRQEQWLTDTFSGMSDPRMAGQFDSVGINTNLAAAQAAIEGINFGTKQSPIRLNLGDGSIRSLDDLQAAVEQATALGQQQGVKFYDLQEDTRKNKFIADPGINEVLQKGGMNKNQREDVARAMFALEAARRTSVNQVDKNFYSVGMGQPARPVEFGGTHESLGGGMVGLAQLGNEKVGGAEVKSKLKGLTGMVDRDGNLLPESEQIRGDQLADARMNLVAGVAGETIPRANFARTPNMGPGPTRLLSEDVIYDRMGPVNGQIANAVIQRFEQAQGTNPDGFGVRVERQRNMDPGPTFTPGPDPWDQPIGTGNGITQEIQSRREAAPQKALPYGLSTSAVSQGPTRPITNELRNQLAELSSGDFIEGPRPAANFSDPGIKPDGPSVSPRRIRQEADYRQAVRNLGRVRGFGRNAAIAGGAVAGLAGLDALIGGESERRQEGLY